MMKWILRFVGVVFLLVGIYSIVQIIRLTSQNQEIYWQDIVRLLFFLNIGAGLIMLFDPARKMAMILAVNTTVTFGLSAILSYSLKISEPFMRIFDKELQLSEMLLILPIGILLFLLLNIKNAQSVTKISTQYGLATGWVLSLLTPGLGHAFAGNFWWGILRYFALRLFMEGITTTWGGTADIVMARQIIHYVFWGFVWIVLAYDDIRTVNRAYNIQPGSQKTQAEQAILG